MRGARETDPVVGVLALQGDFADHEAALGRRGLLTRQVRRPEHLEGLAGLVLPGGESTTMLHLLARQGLEEPLRSYLNSGPPVLATCAGMILLAREVVAPTQRSYGILDITVARNGYGRQIASGTFALSGSGVAEGTTGIFIRAPRILRVGPTITVLARRGEDPAFVRCGQTLATCFHPELDDDHPVVGAFADLVRAR